MQFPILDSRIAGAFTRKIVLLTLAAAVSLTACNGAPQSAALTPSVSSASAGMARPAEEFCKPIVFYGAAWQYEGGTINAWYEYVGAWALISGRLVPCGAKLVGIVPNFFWFRPYWGEVIFGSPWWGCRFCWLFAVPSNMEVYMLTQKGLTEEISTAPYTPAGLAVSPKGTLYVSVAPPQGGSGNAEIYAYSKGSTKLSATLVDPQMGQYAGSIAVDKMGNLYVSYTLTESSESVLKIDKFVGGTSKLVPFATIPNVTGGALATDAKNNVLVAASSGSAGVVEVLSSGGSVVGKIATTSSPSSISLSSNDQTLVVTDAANNLVSSYNYSTHALESQEPTGNGDSSQPWQPGSFALPEKK